MVRMIAHDGDIGDSRAGGSPGTGAKFKSEP